MSSFRNYLSTDSRPKRGHALYRKCGPVAETVKIVLQFLIGIGLVLLLLAKPFSTLAPWHGVALRIQQLVALPTLELVAIALAYSSGFELAYTLFTEGPDEAVEPMIMGLAAAMLLGFSKLERIDVLDGCGAAIFVVALAGLFVVRRVFLKPVDLLQPEDEDQPV
jgi:hypothetical protein